MSTSVNGKFITIEGIEGAGKSSQLAHARECLAAAGKPVLVTREPGGTALAEAVRELLLGHGHDGMSDETELLLMFAARSDHLARQIWPALAEGTWVLCDRFTDATYAYQGGGRGVATETVAELERLVQKDFRPDLTLILDVPVAVGLARAGQRSDPDRFERETERFFERVRSTYLARAEAQPQRCRVIDASGTLDEVRAAVKGALDDFMQAVE